MGRKLEPVERTVDLEGSGLDKRAYNRVVHKAELLTIQLTTSKFDIHADFYAPDTSTKLAFNKSEPIVEFLGEQHVVLGRFGFDCVAKRGKRYILRASAEYLVAYKVPEGSDKRAAELFCEKVGIYAAYPYFRALVAHLAWAANAKLPPMPLIATRGSPIQVPEAPTGS
jgi:hypothetical protein